MCYIYQLGEVRTMEGDKPKDKNSLVLRAERVDSREDNVVVEKMYAGNHGVVCF